MQGDVVGFLEQGLQGAETDAQLLSPVAGDERVVGHHLHPHRLGDAGDMGADLAKAHNPEALLIKLIAHICLAVPTA